MGEGPGAKQSLFDGRAAVVTLLGAIAVFLLLDDQDRHHWDEYYYLFSVREHGVSRLVELESGLALGVFPEGFFSTKAGFLLLVQGLITLFGDGLRGLEVIQAGFAALTVAWALASLALLRLFLPAPDAVRTALVLLFLPLTLYFRYKVLAEVPSLLFATLAAWAFLRGHASAEIPGRSTLLASAVLGLAIATLCRSPSPVFLIGLVIGFAATGDPRYRRTRFVVSGLAVAIAGLGLAIFTLEATGIGSAQLTGPVGDVLSKRIATWPVRLFAAGLLVQFFAPLALIALLPPWPAPVRLALVWGAACALPFVLGHEPRYYYLALLPLAILVTTGFDRVAGWLGADAQTGLWRRPPAWIGILGVLVVPNWLLFAPLMPHEIEQGRYLGLSERLWEQQRAGTQVVAWLSDFALLRFAFPDRQVVLALSEMPGAQPGLFTSRPFLEWVNPERYVGTPSHLRRHPQPWFLLGWTQNPMVDRLKAIADAVGAAPIRRAVAAIPLKDHLALTWLRSHPAVVLDEQPGAGRYRVFRICEASARPEPDRSGTLRVRRGARVSDGSACR